MRKYGTLGLVLAFAFALAGCAMNGSTKDGDDLDGNETPVTIDQLPAAARATLTKEAGAGTIQEIDREMKNGRAVYEADVMLDGKKWEIMVRDDGQLIKKELDEETDGEDDNHEKK